MLRPVLVIDSRCGFEVFALIIWLVERNRPYRLYSYLL